MCGKLPNLPNIASVSQNSVVLKIISFYVFGFFPGSTLKIFLFRRTFVWICFTIENQKIHQQSVPLIISSFRNSFVNKSLQKGKWRPLCTTMTENVWLSEMRSMLLFKLRFQQWILYVYPRGSVKVLHLFRLISSCHIVSVSGWCFSDFQLILMF